jgi:hypothetical protein
MLLWIQLYFKGFRLQDFHFLWYNIPAVSSNLFILLMLFHNPFLKFKKV